MVKGIHYADMHSVDAHESQIDAIIESIIQVVVSVVRKVQNGIEIW